jgi:hypothetical protein
MISAVRRQRLSALLVSAMLFCAPAVSGPALQPFVVDHEHRVDSPLDVRFLLDGTAGEHGFIRVKDGHLANGDGQRFRCWGVNLGGWTPGSALLPPKDSAETYAASLSRLGVNCVRLHFLDLFNASRIVHGQGGAAPDGQPLTEPLSHMPAGLIDAGRNDTNAFNPEQLDRLDYLVYQLKLRGIYVDLNLNVGRSYKEGDGVPDHDLIWVAKGMTHFGPELIARQKEYARDLISHVNPYTRTAYSDEPAVALVEVVNENSLTEFWMRNWLRGDLAPGKPRAQLDLTPHYKALLTARYNDWLKTARRPKQVDQLRKLSGVKAGQPVPLLRRGEFRAAPKERFYAELAFLTHVESSFFNDMQQYLRKTLGVKVPIISTADHTYSISGLPLLRSTSKSEVQDAHAYWQHPAIFGRRATPMVDDPQHSMVVNLARTAMLGKPFTVSEINEPIPNEYSGEMIPIVASYAAFQDWDAVFFYSMEPKLKGEWQVTMGDYFDIAQDPVKIAELPLGALIFLRHDVRAARQTIARSYSKEDINESARAPAATKPYFTPGFPLDLPLTHGSRIRCLDCAPLGKLKPLEGADILSDTGELRWHAAGEQTGFVTAQGEKTEVITGFTASVARNNGSTTHIRTDIENGFGTIGLSSLDGKPLSVSDRMMLVAAGFSQNSGAAWDTRHALMAKWGTAPTLIEPIAGWIILKDLDGAVKVTVTPYDGAGRALPAIEARMLYDGWEFPIGTPSATNYLVSVQR